MNKILTVLFASLAIIGSAQAQSDSTSISLSNIQSALAPIPAQQQQAVSFDSLNIASKSDLANAGAQCPNCTCPKTVQVMSGYKFNSSVLFQNFDIANYPMGSIAQQGTPTKYYIYSPIYSTVCAQ